MTDLYTSRSKQVLKSVENKDNPIGRREGHEKDGKRDKIICIEKENYEGTSTYSKREKGCTKERHTPSVDRKSGRNSNEGQGEKNDLRKVIQNIERKNSHIDINCTTEKDKNISKHDLEYGNPRDDCEDGKRKEDKHEIILLDKIKIDRSKAYKNEMDGHTTRSESDDNMNDSSESLKKLLSPEPSKPRNVQERLRIMADNDGKGPIERGVWLRQQMQAMKNASYGDDDREPTEEEILRQEKLPIIKNIDEYKDPICVWKPIEDSDSNIPPWNKDLLPTEHEEKPSDWAPPSPPKVDKSLFHFRCQFHDEIKNPPAIDKIVTDKERMKVVKDLSDKDELLLLNNLCIIRTTSGAIQKSRRSREIEEEEDARNNSRFSRGGGGRGGRGRGGRGGGRGRGGFGGGKSNANTEPMGAIKRPRSHSDSQTHSKRYHIDERSEERAVRDFRRDNSCYGRESGRQERGDKKASNGRRYDITSYDREDRSRYRQESSRFDRDGERSLRDRSRSRSRLADHKRFRENQGERDNFKMHREPTEAISHFYIGGKRPQSPKRNRFKDSGYRKSKTEKDYPNKSKVRYDDGGTRDRYYDKKFKQERKGSSSDSNSSFGEMPREIKDSSSDSNSSFDERSSTPKRMSYKGY